MPPRVTKRWMPVSSSGEPSGSRKGGERGVDLAADRLSALPDALLHHILSFLKAWDVVRTCVLSRRWRDLWASAPCVDVRVGEYREPPEDFAKFVYRLLLARDLLAPVDTLRLRSPGEEDDSFEHDDVSMWIRSAIKRKVRVIQLNGHLHEYAKLNHMDFVSCHLKILKLSYAELDDQFIRGLFSRCPSLEELDLKRCTVGACEIVSASLRTLTMVKCSVMLDDTLLSCEFEKYQEEDEFPQTSDEDDDNNSGHFKRSGKYAAASDDSDDFMTDDYGYPDDYHDHYSSDIKDDYDYGSDINSDTETYEYSKIANAYVNRQFVNSDDVCDGSKGGHSGEVILRRESISCPTFSNLKTLALGEWCISTGADFDILVLFLQHSPNLEKLFLQLEMNFDIQKALERSTKLKGGSFACKYLKIVKIRCTKDDPRVHMLAQLLTSNGVPLEKIFVRQSGSFYLRNLKLQREITIDELRECGPY
ncbi:hypothetical protein QOZ80_8BG0652420 [Eleusine coracana subsp. coracana]|nr:hypothetical protein QOZ80_8BG0652420 [Eleusine coracana subsp. coracana]